MGDSTVPAHTDSQDALPAGDLIDADGDDVVQPARGMPMPKTPSAAEVAAHNLTHLPYRSWCPHCVAARRPNSHHLSSKSESQRTDPLLVADYCYVRDSEDGEVATVLVARLYPSMAMLATLVDAKGIDVNAVSRLSRFIRDSGYSKIVYKSDQEKPLRALLEETFRAAMRQGELHNPQLTQMVPEASAVGESQSNGRAENAVQKFEDLLRTYKSALETHLESRIAVDHPVMRWLVEHVASTMNRHLCNSEGMTPYEAIHGQRFRGKAVEFGERVFYYVPRKLRAKLNLRWRLGVFIGNAQSTNEAYVAASNGDVIKTRSVVRVVLASRWDKDAILNIRGVPHKFRMSDAEQDDSKIEDSPDPHANLDGPEERADPQLKSRGSKDKSDITKDDAKKVDVRITANDIERFGYSDDCPRCKDLEVKGKSYRHHNDACKLRFYLEFKEVNHPKWRMVKHLFEEKDDKFSASKVDAEGAAKTPKADLSPNLFEGGQETPKQSNEPNSVTEDFMPPDEDEQVEKAINESIMDDIQEDVNLNEDDLADMFGDFGDSPMDGWQADNADGNMETALRMAGVSPVQAKSAASSMTSRDPPSTFVEVYGTSIFDHSLMSRRNLNVEGLHSFDLRSLKPDGHPWDFTKRTDRKLAREMIRESDPDWVIGAPPCTAFSIWNHGMNYKKMDQAEVQRRLREGRLHLNFVCSLYRRQMARGKFFLHEHPASALSWREHDIEALSRLPMVNVVTMHQCQYGLVTPSSEDPEKLVPAMKPTRWMTNSLVMAQQLQKKCDGSHKHQHLVGGRCKDASFYPIPLVKAILKGISLQRIVSTKASSFEEEQMKVHAMPMLHGSPTPQSDFGPPHKSTVPKMNGGKLPVVYEECNFKSRYLDEYTGEILPPPLIRDAIEDELNYFNSKVWEICSMEEMRKVPDYILVRSRWVLCNKGDADNPDVRARLVSCELNNGEKNDFFSASTPPLEGKRMLFSKYTSERHRKGKPLRLSFVDIRKAYFNALPERAIFMKVPKELGFPPGTVARQVRCVYGTRDAGKLWEDTYTQVLEGIGFQTGVSNPCVFFHPARNISIVVHGDDFTALATDDQLDWYEDQLKKSFEIKIRGRLGEGCTGAQEIRILNRIVAVDELGLRYEADPRHGDLLFSSLDLSTGSSAATPGVKPVDRDANAEKSDEPEVPSLMDYSDPDSVIAAIVLGKYDASLSDAQDSMAKGTTFHSSHKAPVGISSSESDTHWARPQPTSACPVVVRDTHGLGATSESDTHWACAQPTSACPAAVLDTHGLGASRNSNLSNHSYSLTSILKTPSDTSLNSQAQTSISPIDSWIVEGQNGVWIRSHPLTRRALISPSECAEGLSNPTDQESLSSLRFTCGRYRDGTRFSFMDSWRKDDVVNAHLRQPWKGITCFFNRDCECIDDQVNRISSLHDVQMKQIKRVDFNLERVETIEVQPYSETLPLHPHLIVATRVGWKRIPSRSDPFTGKSANVMKARHSELSRHFGSQEARRRRRRLIQQSSRSTPMVVDSDPSTSMQVDAPSSTRHPVFANRTKPEKNNKYQKRVGAKTAKKLELAENSAFELSPADATMYRALAARCNYLSQDRPDIAFSSKELCREFSVPNKMSFQKLKRLARYLCGMPRLVYRYPWQDMPDVLDVYVDTDFAGCQSTRRSTSGGIAMVGNCLLKHWSKTQTTISLSSGEAELHGIAYGAAQALGLQSLLLDLGWSLRIRIHSDATAAIGICRRKGIGKIRHLATTDLWIQDKVRSKTLELCKVLGSENPADVMTKYVPRQTMEQALSQMGLVALSGRPASAPAAMGA